MSRVETQPRVLFLINDLRMGGAERSLANRVNHLRRVCPTVVLIEPAAGSLVDEFSPHLQLFSLHTPQLKPISRTELRAIGAVVLRRPRGLPPGQMLLESPMLLQRAYRLARLVRATGAEVVSTFLNRSHTIALVAKALFVPRLRVVINVQEMLSESLQRHFGRLERRLMRAFITSAFPRARRIIAVSDGVRDELVSHFAIPKDRVAVVPSPIDVAKIRSASEDEADGMNADPPSGLIVGVGRLVRLKGFDLLIRAVARLPHPLDAKLFLVGEGEERDTLAQLIVELGLIGRVRLLGAQANPWKYMARATVVAMPSRTEAFPNVIGEALALGVPVVAAHCSAGVADYLENGRCGVLVPPEDIGALAAALERVLTDASLRRQLRAEGMKRARAFDPSEVVPRYERLIVEAARE